MGRLRTPLALAVLLAAAGAVGATSVFLVGSANRRRDRQAFARWEPGARAAFQRIPGLVADLRGLADLVSEGAVTRDRASLELRRVGGLAGALSVAVEPDEDRRALSGTARIFQQAAAAITVATGLLRDSVHAGRPPDDAFRARLAAAERLYARALASFERLERRLG